MSHRHFVLLVLIASAVGLGACAAERPAPTPAATPGQPAPASEEHEEQSVAPATAPAGQAAPSSATEGYGAAEKGPSSLTTGEDKTKAMEFKSVADAEKALAKANQQLALLYTPEANAAMGGAARSSAGKPVAKKAPETSPSADQESRCGTACKAFASLKRAADAVCRLAGDDDARCDHARKLVDENGRRVAQCGCRDGG